MKCDGVKLKLTYKEGGHHMPCIKCTVNYTLSEKNKENLRSGLTEAIQLIPGKTADSLMVILDDAKYVAFHQNSEVPNAFVEVNLFRRNDPSEFFPAKNEKICMLLQDELGISGENVYIRYLATTDWGWNGKNF